LILWEVKSMSTNHQAMSWHGVPRDEIEWHPMVVEDRCVGCGLCTTSCGCGVYAFDYERNVPVVARPVMCMVGCTTCATICMRDAIDFPSQGYIRQIIRDQKLLRQSKDMLRENREKYDINQMLHDHKG
jgi:NAD-dependent dihydropyrimidine dehydrogenase PreA subunit